MKFTLIIPAWNEAEFLTHTLALAKSSLHELSAQSSHVGNIVVVDNNSTDETAAIAAEQSVTVVFEPINQIAKARNRGAAEATGEALIFMDADSSCSSELLLCVLEKLESGQCVGGGSLIAPDRPISGAALRLLNFWNLLAKRGRLAAGCFIYCRKDAFEQIGGFNTRVYAGEEIYLSRALKKWGRQHGMSFDIVSGFPVITSVRKLDWYSPMQMIRQALIVFVPGALYSKRLCKTWYDPSRRDKL